MTDNTADYALTALITVVLVAALFGLIAWGWRRKKRRQQDLPTPLEVPAELLDAEPLAAAEGMYVATVRGRDWLDRIAVHGLGLRTGARMEVHPGGVALFRAGAANLFLTAEDLTDVRLESGMVGKFVERDGLVVISWLLGAQAGPAGSDSTEVSTGFRTRTAADRDPLLTALAGLVPPHRTVA